MTDPTPDRPDDGPHGEFDWESPRWRVDDGDAASDQRGRRARGDPAPRQRGAIDEGGSIGGKATDRGAGSPTER